MGSWQNLFPCASISELAKPSSLVQVWMLMCVKTSSYCFVLPVSYSLRPRFRLQRPVARPCAMHGKQTCWHPGCSDSWYGPIIFSGLVPVSVLSSLSCHPSQDSMWVTAGSQHSAFSSSRGSFASPNLPVHILMYIHKILFRKSWSKVFPFFQWSRFKPGSLYVLVNIIPLSYTPSCKDNVLIYNDGYLRGWWLN